MTEQELIEIKTELEHSEIPRPSQEKILEACKKQVAKKEVQAIITNRYGDQYYNCPTCGEVTGINKIRRQHCPTCGQKVERGDNDE